MTDELVDGTVVSQDPRPTCHRLDGRTVVVTGAAGGIGGAIARRVTEEGARLAALDLDAERLSVAAAEFGALPKAVDVTDLAALEDVASQIEDELGPVTVLIHAAGGSRGEAVPFLELDAVIWHQMVDRNLTGAFHAASVFGRRIAAAGGGSLVLVSSQLSVVTRPGLAHYAAAKGAINQLVKGLAVDLAPHDIRVNAVAPGPTLTPGNKAWFERPEVEEEHRRIVPMGRIAEPAEIAGAAVHFASDEASFTTGAVLFVDGGYTAL